MKKMYWTIVRSLGFIVIGLFNTVFIKPEDIATWKNYLGYVVLIIGIIDLLVVLFKNLRKK